MMLKFLGPLKLEFTDVALIMTAPMNKWQGLNFGLPGYNGNWFFLGFPGFNAGLSWVDVVVALLKMPMNYELS